MTPRQQFKFDILTKCAAAGMSLAEAREAIRTTLTKQGNIFMHLAELGLIGAAGAGVAGGYGAAKLTEPPADVDEAKQQELIAAYHLHADRARRMAKRYTYQQNVPRSPRFSMNNDVAQPAQI